MYNPCLQCKLRFGKEYTNECDDKCDYANVIRNFRMINEKLEDYYKQQTNNEYVSEQQKRLICRVIENCQKIVVELENNGE